MHEVFLAGLNYEHDGFRNAAIRGVRAIQGALGGDTSLGFALDVVRGFIETPTVKRKVGQHDDLDVAQAAVVAATDYTAGAASFEIDPDDLELPDPGLPDEDESVEDTGPFSPASYATALVLLSIASGSPLGAYVRAHQLGRATDDGSLYQEVQAVLVEVFQLAVTAGDDDDDGPDVHIVVGSAN